VTAKRRIDLASWATLGITVALFIVSLVEKGLTHEILLETAVFLVSIKLVLASRRSHLDMQVVEDKLDRLLEQRPDPEPKPLEEKRRRMGLG
jgi:hypothetical protein